eukprot:CAMPEP_0113415632 /NCGR_PEP_ID=MMETSP0013_2-20120614/24669_1 /TAXON_ID=2843 ORGANISM="Skeletonema costatum, Strain 1716" /NCGR_SAMPLE_ID=MMETSP0013_2 /ASSEMBLY_ACC=CAM_ASM_000158 /LENGTH=1447 /DNA_ID=CAMNT_0000302599 /DNA_START=90 /DNA_END=4429 /DNA_ORIENTATION=+ /assembly_acc=CAM_ASM_000158
MHKRFNVKSKLKFSSGGKAPDSSAANSNTGTAAASTSSNIRAEYYASRQAGNNNLSSSAANPFDDDEDDRGIGGPSRPTASARFGNNNSKAAAANPFGDSSSDEEDNDPLAGFGRKPPPPPPQPSRGRNNPPPAPAAARPPPPVKAASSSAGGGNNPFGEDSDEDEGIIPPPPRRAAAPSSSNSRGKNQNNPFDSPPPQQQHQQQLRASVKASSGNNPFGDDDDDNDIPPPRRTGRGAATNTSSLRSSSRGATNPFGEDTLPKPTFGNAAGGGSSNNPFNEGGGGGGPPPQVPKAMSQSTPSPSNAIHGAGGTNNPFDAGDGSGGVVPKRPSNRWNNNSRSVNDTDSVRPILTAMDEESIVTTGNNTIASSSSNNLSSNAAGLASWLRLNKKEDDGPHSQQQQQQRPHANEQFETSSYHTNNNHQTSKAGPPSNANKAKKYNSNVNKPKKSKNKAFVTPWPFDNYHEVQEKLYEELASQSAMSAASGIGGDGGGYHSGDDGDEKKEDMSRRRSHRQQQQRGKSIVTNTATDDSQYYERPEELPSIKEAVNDLALVDFEKKAEDRAVNIVSTWLFDAGLIDELLVNGAMNIGMNNTSQSSSKVPSSSHSVMSEKTSEGQEIGMHGFPLVGAEGAELKMDKETNKLRGMIQRDLSIINARLNDGVAASGLEVQELVNAVSATKDDIGRLRELTTYISDGQISDRDEFLLAKYPYMRKAINARRNINRTFRELEFFSQIPSTCDRLRDELHGGEWTAEEWSTIRNVSMEHVELEIMLVEAENSMKSSQHNFNVAMVDNFLSAHVQNVWELGDEIRMRIISGIGSAFDLSINNPAGMVALVEAVEVYERAAESFEKKRQERGDSGDLRFTNMRAAALEQLYQDFELRGVEMFRGVHEHAADIADEEDAANTQFTAVLKAATELVTEIDIVKHQMSPCFAPHWHVEALWSSCVAHVCSNHIVQQIGGPDGQNLPDLTITQLLELVAWVEYFRETIEETFPEVASKRDTKKTYFEERPELFAGDKRTVNMKNATDSLAWVNNMLWEVHRLAQEEFLVRTRSQTDEWLDKVYGSESVKNQSADGKLTTSLCEDVFSFSSVQLRTIQERLSKKSDALILAVCIILSHMRSKQIHARNNYLQDLETCCAASNDFTRMSEKCEDMVAELMGQCEFAQDMVATLEASSNELMGVYSSDAVYSARSVHIYVFDPIDEEIGVRLFEESWEVEMVQNDLALSLVRTLEDFHEDLEHYMDDFMVVKSVMSLMSATVIFYTKCLLQRAEKHRNNKKPFFGDVKTALDRMTGDIKVMKEYFESLVPQMPALKKNIEKDFEIISTIHELMCIAAGLSVSEAEDFILVLQKRVRDVGITKHIVGDLWHLVAPTEERYVWELVDSMEDTLVAIAPVDDALALEVNDRSYVKGLRLDEMAVKLYVKSRRNRPIKATAVEHIVKSWKTT